MSRLVKVSGQLSRKDRAPFSGVFRKTARWPDIVSIANGAKLTRRKVRGCGGSFRSWIPCIACVISFFFLFSVFLSIHFPLLFHGLGESLTNLRKRNRRCNIQRDTRNLVRITPRRNNTHCGRVVGEKRSEGPSGSRVTSQKELFDYRKCFFTVGSSESLGPNGTGTKVKAWKTGER